MRKISLLLLVWVVAISAAAQNKPVEILLFKGVSNAGNNLIPSQPGIMTAEQCINFDLSDSTLKPRTGFTGHKTQTTTDSTQGIFGFRNNDGESRFFAYVHRAGFDYCEMLWSPVHSMALGTGGTKYLYYNTTPSWAVWDDILVVANGKNRPWRYNGTGWGQLVPTAPGSPDYAPNYYHTDVHFLHGDYYYAVQMMLPCSTISGQDVWGLISSLSPRIRVDSGSMSVFYYPESGVTASCADPDSSIFKLLRTRGGADWSDSLFLVATLEIQNPIGATSAMRDSVPDDSLGSIDYWYNAVRYGDSSSCPGGDGVSCDSMPINYPYVGVLDTLIREADVVEDSLYRPGQPQWMSTDSSAAGGEGPGAQLDTSLITHHRYGVCYYDSSTRAMSPMGPVLRVPSAETTPATPVDSIINIALPNITQSESHLWRIIFRAREYEDTVRVPDSTWDDDLHPPDQIVPSITPDRSGGSRIHCPDGYYIKTVGRQSYCVKGYWSYFAAKEKHTIIGGYYPLDTIKSSADTTYADTLDYVILEARIGAYEGVILPTQFNYPTIYKNRLFAAEGSYVYYTTPSDIGEFESYFVVSLDDGEEITGLHVSGNELLIFKNGSIHKAIWVGTGYISEEYIPGIGCIAPESIIDMPGGGYGFLSEQGYYVFTTYLQSLYKESGGNLPNLSAPIWENLSAYSMSDLRECHTYWSDDWQTLLLSFPTLDSTWAYFSNGMGWSVYDFAFRQTVRHDTTYSTNVIPASTVWGARQADDSIYVLRDTTLNKGDSIEAIYKANPILKSHRKSQIKAMGVWAADDGKSALTVKYYDMDGSTIATDVISSTEQYKYWEPFLGDPSHWWQIEFKTKHDTCNLEIKGLDLWPMFVTDPTGD